MSQSSLKLLERQRKRKDEEQVFIEESKEHRMRAQNKLTPIESLRSDNYTRNGKQRGNEEEDQYSRDRYEQNRIRKPGGGPIREERNSLDRNMSRDDNRFPVRNEDDRARSHRIVRESEESIGRYSERESREDSRGFREVEPTSREYSNISSSSRGDYPRESSKDRNLATWPRNALEARVETLERLLAEKQTPSSLLSNKPEDRDLAEHLQVTVRKNRELRAELEVTKNKLASLLEERESFAMKLNRDNDTLQSLLEEAQRAKDALGNCIKALSAEKNDLSNRLQLAEEEIVRLRSSASGPLIRFDEVRGNIDDISVINEGLKESLRQMKLKNPSYMGEI